MSVLLGSSYHPEGCWLMPQLCHGIGVPRPAAPGLVAGTPRPRPVPARGQGPDRGQGSPRCDSEVAALVLLALDGLEERLEVALAETERTVPLDELEEDRRAVAERLGEDLQQVAVLVPVDEDLALLQLLDRHPDVADALAQLGILVVAVGGVEELHAVGTQRVD